MAHTLDMIQNAEFDAKFQNSSDNYRFYHQLLMGMETTVVTEMRWFKLFYYQFLPR